MFLNVCCFSSRRLSGMASIKDEVEEVKEVAKYILRNASVLNIAVLTAYETLELLEELKNVVKDSNSSCQLHMVDPLYKT
ncbi:unnamed protein product [Cochlearia groenlandica]